jgi:hypothetical protein
LSPYRDVSVCRPRSASSTGTVVTGRSSEQQRPSSTPIYRFAADSAVLLYPSTRVIWCGALQIPIIRFVSEPG